MYSKFDILLGLEWHCETILTKSCNLVSEFAVVEQCIVCSTRSSSPRGW